MADVFTRCDYCDKDFSGPEPYGEHLNSIAHQKKEMAALKPVNPYSTVIASNTNGNGSYYCEDCKISLSGPDPYQQHILGSKHISQIKKKQILTNLQGNDEITPTSCHVPNKENYRGESTKEVLSCKTCNKSFSGPICAEQHLKSKKHRRKTQLLELGNRVNGIMPAPTCPGMEIYPKIPKTKDQLTRADAMLDHKEKSGQTNKGCFSVLKNIFKSKEKNPRKIKVQKPKKNKKAA